MGNQASSGEENHSLTSVTTDDPPSASRKFYQKTWMQKRGALEDQLQYCKHRGLQRHEEIIKLAEDPESNIQLKKPTKDALNMMGDFQHYIPDHEDVVDGSVTLLPTLTCGYVLIPGAFIEKDKALDPKAMSRKYLLLQDDSDLDKIWELLIRTWRLPHPNLVISLISGTADHMQLPLDSFYQFCSQTGVWILSDGMHSRSSLIVSKACGYGRNSERDGTDGESASGVERGSSELTLIGIPLWRDLGDPDGDKALLYGMSLEQFYDSYYFYPKENDLEAGEMPQMANPYQNAYLFESTIGDRRGSLRGKLLKYLQGKHPRPGEKPHNEDAYKGKAFMPTVNLVIGGSAEEEEEILAQIVDSVENQLPVVVASVGEIPRRLKKVFLELEKIERRNTVIKADFTEEEDNKLKEILNEFGSNRYHHAWHTVMKHRYYLTLLDMDESHRFNSAAFIAGILKGREHEECLSSALLTGSLDFVKAAISREVDPNFESELNQIDFDELGQLHALYLSKNNRMSRILFDEISQDIKPNNALALVGKSLFYLMGWKYTVQYQEKGKFLSQLRDLKTQIWHLFIYAILSNKRIEMVLFLGSLTKSPLGAAMFAHKLYKRMSDRAKYWLEDGVGDTFDRNAEKCIELSEKMMEYMYSTSKAAAYRSLIRELPFNLGEDVTPLTLAIDSDAKHFICSSCCQTYVRTVWLGGFYPCPWRHIVAAVFPLIGWFFLPHIAVDDETTGPFCATSSTQAYTQHEQKCSCWPACNKCVTLMRNLVRFYSAPATKFVLDLVAYLAFLAVFSAFILSDLQPIASVTDVKVTEWLTYIFALGRIVEECNQIYMLTQSPLKNTKLAKKIWPFSFRKFLLKSKVFKLKFYLDQGSWNTLDCTMLLFFLVSTICRFTVSHNDFQVVRILFCTTILLFYTRILRFLYVFSAIGPRVIAITLMLAELAKMCLVLLIFILGFGVAFQALLNPGQSASWMGLVDLLYRPYWQMYGEIFLDDATSEMGRSVGNFSCEFLKENGNPELNCYPAFPYLLIAFYLLVSNVLLLNLVIAIFGNTLNVVETRSKVHYAFEQCVLTQEYYYKAWVPSPFNLVWLPCVCIHSLCTFIWNKCHGHDTGLIDENPFRLDPLQDVDKFQYMAYAKCA